MLVLRAVGDEEEDPAARQALYDGVEEGVSLGVHPVQAVEDQEKRLDPALTLDQSPERVEHVLAAAERIQRLPRGVLRGAVAAMEGGGARRPGGLPVPVRGRRAHRGRSGLVGTASGVRLSIVPGMSPEPGAAICAMRAARWVVWPTAV